jgi:hypothetical protein
MRTTWRDVLLLVALQFGASLAISVLLALLRINDGSNSWVGIVGAMIGAQVFAILREKKRPGFVPASAHELSIGSSAFEASLGAVFFLAARKAGLVQVSGGGFAVLIMLTVLLNYGLTRWGLRLGIRYVQKAAAEKDATKE